MIYLKLAGRNFKRSLRDYAIYFFTVAVSVMIFYTFNALTDMPVIQELAQKGGFSPESLKFMLISISVFVAFVVFVLVIFSNNFIIRRRNREIGTYLLLGMNQRKVARMLFLETIALGVLACLLGLGLGVAFSGIFSLIFSLILGNVTPTLQFSLSVSAIKITAIFYALIFLAVAMFGSRSVSRFTLSKLLLSQRQNEVYKVRSRWWTAVIGVLSLIVLGVSYWLALTNLDPQRFNPLSGVFILVAGLVTLGSLGFFYAGVGFLLGLLRRVEKVFWKGLNSFSIGQILRKINSNTLVLTATNLLLAITITSVVLLGIMQSLFSALINQPLSFSYIVQYLTPADPMDGFLRAAESNPDNPLQKSLTVSIYPTEVDAALLLNEKDRPQIDAWLPLHTGSTCQAIDRSTYNQLLQAAGFPLPELSADEIGVQISAQYPQYAQHVAQAAQTGMSLSLFNQKYVLADVQQDSVSETLFSQPCTLVIPADMVDNLPTDGAQTSLLLQYAQPKDPLIEQNLEAEIYRIGHGYWDSLQEREDSYRMVQSMFMIAGLYLEFIFLMACAMVLAMQLMIDTLESSRQYLILRNLGADEAAIERTLFHQVTFYFFAPVGLALVHSAFALYGFSHLLGSYLAANIGILLIPLLVLIGVYGTYYLLTWKTCARLIRQSISI